jgi:hypothetical protein
MRNNVFWPNLLAVIFNVMPTEREILNPHFKKQSDNFGFNAQRANGCADL